MPPDLHLLMTFCSQLPSYGHRGIWMSLSMFMPGNEFHLVHEMLLQK